MQDFHPAAPAFSSLAHTAARPDIEPWLTALLNDLSLSTQAHVLVLDDYHVINVPDVHHVLAFLIDQLPLQVYLVIARDTDPLLLLTHLRARQQLIELRTADLSLTPIEAAAFLNEIMHLNLTQADIAALAERTEGWIAGLQMAALSPEGAGIDRVLCGPLRAGIASCMIT